MAGLPTFAPIVFHLLASYSLIAARRAALCRMILVMVVSRSCFSRILENLKYLVLCKLGIVHVLFRNNKMCEQPAAFALCAARGLGEWLTLYQCFFTLPSVRCGNDCVHNSSQGSEALSSYIFQFPALNAPLLFRSNFFLRL